MELILIAALAFFGGLTFGALAMLIIVGLALS